MSIPEINVTCDNRGYRISYLRFEDLYFISWDVAMLRFVSLETPQAGGDNLI